MNKLVDQISALLADAFQAAGYDPAYGKATVSNRPDLCEYQCNGALAAAKAYHKAPIAIAGEVAAQLNHAAFSQAEAVAPGFINLRLAPEYLCAWLEQMRTDEHLGVPQQEPPRTIVVDYGGANVAKPLHVGHLRPAIIGEAICRMERYVGNEVIGDVHLGDWGLQMGLIVEGVRERQPDLPYFDAQYTGEYPDEAPFTISDLEQIYPAASARSKVDAAFSARAHEATLRLQKGERGYRALFEQIMKVSVADLKKNYESLDVHFTLWKGESDAEPYIGPMIQRMRDEGYAVQSQGALVVEVQTPEDTKDVPPCILLKSDGATLYATTDLATLVQREEDFHPDQVIYVVDKRQALHFEQVFRAAHKTGIVRPETRLQFLGFGTMNGKDGKPFKTRDGGVMRLEALMGEITDTVRQRIEQNQVIPPEKMEQTAHTIAVAALKYGDLSNLATKDYAFDIERFCAFEGNTGPYLLYTIVRIKSIMSKYGGEVDHLPLRPAENPLEKDLQLCLTRFADQLLLAVRDTAPNVLCAYCYELACAANRFYHDVKILQEPDEEKKQGYLALLRLTSRVLETAIDLLGFTAPEQM